MKNILSVMCIVNVIFALFFRCVSSGNEWYFPAYLSIICVYVAMLTKMR